VKSRDKTAYPRQYVSDWTLKDGTPVIIRPIRPDDEPLMAAFHKGLSEETVHSRYGGILKLGVRVAHERLSRLCDIDYGRQMALVVDRTDPASGGHEILGVGRLIKSDVDPQSAEFAIVIADRWQGQGLGARLLGLLIAVGRAEGLQRITAQLMPAEHVMLRMCGKAGFTVDQRGAADGGACPAVLVL
jgi:acetyltransferase